MIEDTHLASRQPARHALRLPACAAAAAAAARSHPGALHPAAASKPCVRSGCHKWMRMRGMSRRSQPSGPAPALWSCSLRQTTQVGVHLQGCALLHWPVLLVGADVDTPCTPAAPVLCRAVPCHCGVTPRRLVLSHAHAHAMHVMLFVGKAGHDHAHAAMACHLTPCCALHTSSNTQQLN